MAKLSVELQRYFFEEDRQPHVKLADILALAGERAFGFLFVILSLPSALPLPAPVISIPFGIMMFLLAIQLIIGAKRPWLPPRIVNSSMKLEKAQAFVKAGIPWLQKFEALTSPRLSFICISFPGRLVIGIAIILMSTFMMIPIPGTNTVPAIGIFITSFGLLEDDGLISLAGLAICTFVMAIAIGIFVYGLVFLEQVKDGIKVFLEQVKDWLFSLLGSSD
ncbi:MAG: exopolysaccharide biosynthesis protein [Symploca sp. SIO2E9]|nr:exopolysaccharide biosynthesis protein [Symploca sp. SIO2E9]